MNSSSKCSNITHTGGKMNIYEIRKQCPFEELGYIQLTQLLKSYKEPRSKIKALLKAQDLVRVKKGLYIFGKKAAILPFSQEHLANLAYGPSAISLEYALSFYNMIPERVYDVTSITTRKNKEFETPIGRFSYRFLTPKKFPIGLTQISVQGRNIIMATKEKAICDLLSLKTENLKSKTELRVHLFENLRIEKEALDDLNVDLIKEIKLHYRKKNISLLLAILEDIIHEKSN